MLRGAFTVAILRAFLCPGGHQTGSHVSRGESVQASEQKKKKTEDNTRS